MSYEKQVMLKGLDTGKLFFDFLKWKSGAIILPVLNYSSLHIMQLHKFIWVFKAYCPTFIESNRSTDLGALLVGIPGWSSRLAAGSILMFCLHVFHQQRAAGWLLKVVAHLEAHANLGENPEDMQGIDLHHEVQNTELRTSHRSIFAGQMFPNWHETDSAAWSVII